MTTTEAYIVAVDVIRTILFLILFGLFDRRIVLLRDAMLDMSMECDQRLETLERREDRRNGTN